MPTEQHRRRVSQRRSVSGCGVRTVACASLALLVLLLSCVSAAYVLRVSIVAGPLAAAGVLRREKPLLHRIDALVAAASRERTADGVAAAELREVKAALALAVNAMDRRQSVERAARARHHGVAAAATAPAIAAVLPPIPLLPPPSGEPTVLRAPRGAPAAVGGPCTGSFLVAYCDDRVGWIVKRWAPLLFPRTCTQVVNWDTSSVATQDAVDVRICYRHNTKVIRDMTTRRGGRQVTVKETLLNPAGSPLVGARGEWTSSARGLFWPKNLLRVVAKGGDGRTPMKPFIVSWNDEPWFKGTEGADLQVEAKRCDPNEQRWFTSFNQNCPTYKPLMPWTIMVYGFAEWQPGHLSSFEDVLVRPSGFSGAAVLRKKKLFCAFQHYNCGSHSVSSVMRNAFFEYLSAHYKPVSATGPCKASKDKAVVDKLRSLGATKSVKTSKGNEDYTQKFEHFKFVLTWENAFLPGYVSERPMTAYIAHAVPIFWGAPDVVPDFIDPRAVIACNEPPVTEKELKQMQREVKQTLSPREREDKHAVRDALEKRMSVVFKTEVRARGGEGGARGINPLSTEVEKPSARKYEFNFE